MLRRVAEFVDRPAHEGGDLAVKRALASDT
jgi:hypothetical protein